MKGKEGIRRICIGLIISVLLISGTFVMTSRQTKAAGALPKLGSVGVDGVVETDGVVKLVKDNEDVSFTKSLTRDENDPEGVYTIQFDYQALKDLAVKADHINIVFLLDSSGSMNYPDGNKYKSAKEGVKNLVSALYTQFKDSGIHMKLIPFASNAIHTNEWMATSAFPDADYSRKTVDTGTNIQEALEYAELAFTEKNNEGSKFKDPKNGNVQNFVFLLGDGEPTLYTKQETIRKDVKLDPTCEDQPAVIQRGYWSNSNIRYTKKDTVSDLIRNGWLLKPGGDKDKKSNYYYPGKNCTDETSDGTCTWNKNRNSTLVRIISAAVICETKEVEEIERRLYGDGSKTDDDTRSATYAQAASLRKVANVYSLGYSIPKDSSAEKDIKAIAGIGTNILGEDEILGQYFSASESTIDAICKNVYNAIVTEYKRNAGTITDAVPEPFVLYQPETYFTSASGASYEVKDGLTYVKYVLNGISKTKQSFSYKVKINGTVDEGWYSANDVSNENVKLTYTIGDQDYKIVMDKEPQVYWYQQGMYKFVYYKDSILGDVLEERELQTLYPVGTKVPYSSVSVESSVTANGEIYDFVGFGEQLQPSGELVIQKGMNVIPVIYKKRITHVDVNIRYMVHDASGVDTEVHSEVMNNVPVGTYIDVQNDYAYTYVNGFPNRMDMSHAPYTVVDAGTNFTTAADGNNSATIIYQLHDNADSNEYTVHYYDVTEGRESHQRKHIASDESVRLEYGSTVDITQEMLHKHVNELYELADLPSQTSSNSTTQLTIEKNKTNVIEIYYKRYQGTYQIVYHFDDNEEKTIATSPSSTRFDAGTMITFDQNQSGENVHVLSESLLDSQINAYMELGEVYRRKNPVVDAYEKVVTKANGANPLQFHVYYESVKTSYTLAYYLENVDGSLEPLGVITTAKNYNPGTTITISDSAARALITDELQKIIDEDAVEIDKDTLVLSENDAENVSNIVYKRASATYKVMYYNESVAETNIVGFKESDITYKVGSVVSNDVVDANAYVDDERYAFDPEKTEVLTDTVTITKNADNVFAVVYHKVDEPVKTGYLVNFWLDEIGESNEDEHFIGSYTSEETFIDGTEIASKDIDTKRFLKEDALYEFVSIDKETLTITVGEDNTFNVIYTKKAPVVDGEDKPSRILEPKVDTPTKEEPKPTTTILGLPAIATGDVNNAIAYGTLLLLASASIIGMYRLKKKNR